MLSVRRERSLLIVCVLSLLLFHGVCAMSMLGKPKDIGNVSNSLEIDELANFAVTEFNSRQNGVDSLSFSKVVSAKQQVVQGTMYHLTIEVLEANKPKLYDAKVWVKAWENFKKLEEFKPAASQGGLPGGVRSCGNALGLQTVPVDDPVVREAAEHAVKKLQQSSNSLAPYELSEIVSAKAESKDSRVSFDLVLKAKRGTKEEPFNAQVHRTEDGVWSVAHATSQ